MQQQEVAVMGKAGMSLNQSLFAHTPKSRFRQPTVPGSESCAAVRQVV